MLHCEWQERTSPLWEVVCFSLLFLGFSVSVLALILKASHSKKRGWSSRCQALLKKEEDPEICFIECVLVFSIIHQMTIQILIVLIQNVKLILSNASQVNYRWKMIKPSRRSFPWEMWYEIFKFSFCWHGTNISDYCQLCWDILSGQLYPVISNCFPRFILKHQSLNANECLQIFED